MPPDDLAPATTAPPGAYDPRRRAASRFLDIRGLRCHAWEWAGAPADPRPTLVLMHGWMDVAASFQFVVDALADVEGPGRRIVAADWRGFGLSEAPRADCYWFPDYLADLDVLLAQLSPDAPVDLLGHSMGGNVVMVYAGVRPGRVRRLVNLEGFGMPRTKPAQAPGRLAQWLDEMREPPRLSTYATLADVAERLRRNNPLLPADKAAFLAAHWSAPGADGRWHLQADPAHKRVNPVLYQVDEVLEAWRRITAPVLWVEGDRTDTSQWWGQRYPRAEFEERLAVVPQLQRERLSPAGHMLHHDQPEALARRLAAFLG